MKYLIASFALLFSQVSLGMYEPSDLPGFEVENDQIDRWYQTYLTRSNEIEELKEWSQYSDKHFYINSLINTKSPYLLRHAFNPVAWYEWNNETLNLAQRNNKLIFLSIGYSSCHWCHVMERESFMDKDVAEVLNKSFISIKVDKEVSPDIDHRYTLALELTRGSSGWPVSAVLTPTGDVVFIDAYIDKERLIRTASRLAENWKVKQRFFEQSASLFMREVDKLMSVGVDIKPINSSTLKSEHQKIKSRFDLEYGGIKGEVKFPEPALYDMLLNNAQREGDKELAAFLKLSLNNLYQRGLYDHLHGGFFRYSTNPDYSIPHFEKMLYTQAHMIRIYARAYRILDEPRYLDVAKDIIEFSDEWLRSEQGLYYSAVDAEYEHREGGYYLWSENNKNVANKSIKEKVVWGAVSNEFLPSYPTSNSIRSKLKSIKLSQEKSEKPFIDKKIVTSWNSYFVEALIEMYAVTNDSYFLQKAENISEQLWKVSWDEKQHRVSRIIFYGEKQADNSVEDTVRLGLTFLNLYKHTLETEYLEKARTLLDSLENHYLKHGSNNKVYSLDSLGYLIANDGEGYSTLGELSKFLLELRRAKESISLRYKDSQLFEVISTRFSENPLARLSLFSLLSNHLHGKVQRRHFFANGEGVAVLSKGQDINSYKLTIALTDNWHVNSNIPAKKELIPTSVELLVDGDKVAAEVIYPEPTIKSLSFANTPLSLYEGVFEIEIINRQHKVGQYLLELKTQACSDKVCLFPETLLFPL